MKPLSVDQQNAIDFALSREGANIFARPGKGKTRIALEVIQETDLPTLVVSPLLPAMTVWRQEAAKWGMSFQDDMRLLHGTEKRAGTEFVSIINYEGLPWLAEQDWLDEYGLIIYDEVSKLKAPGTARFRRWRRLMPQFDYRLGLTGTPEGNRVMDLWGEMYCADLGETLGRTFVDFQRKYCIPHQYLKHVWEPRLGAHEEIYEAIKPNAMSLDFAPKELPELIHNKIHINLSVEHAKAYESMQAHSVTSYNGIDILAANAAVASGKLRQMASGAVYVDAGQIVKMHTAKIDALTNLVDELGGSPLLVFYEFKHELDAMRRAFGKLRALNGDTKASDIPGIVDDFNAGKIPILPAHPRTAGMGGNMQQACKTVAFFTIPWSLEMLEQAIGRVWRTGQGYDVTVHYLLVNGTIDEDVFETATVEKKGNQDRLFEVLG